MSEWDDTTDEQDSNAQAIAIIGMAGRFPGAATLDAFWQNLRDGVESITFFSDEELAALGVDQRLLDDPQFVKAGAMLAGIELFDAAFFGYSPREAELIDPQQRLFLECAWTALEHAGYAPKSYPGLIGVYAGMGISTYLLFNLLSNTDLLEQDSALVMLGNDKDFLSTRVSYNLNLRGPSIDLQTGCSTSLVAAHVACEHLLSYQCDLALAGGVAISMPQRTGYAYEPGGIASPDGHCRAFDAQAQGSIFGSGVGVVILKRFADALADGDTIYALIKGSAINNDGALKVGFTAPSIDGQSEVIARAQAIAGVPPETISYIETHGTGTALGDPMEVTALTRAFRAGTDQSGFCALGSVKTNIGHLDIAAGVAGLIKTTLALQHKQLPASLHFQAANPQIDFANTPFYVNTALTAWPANGTPRRAGVSSFGFGGTNAHFILEEAPPVAESDATRPWQVLLLSARSAAALEAATDQLVAHLRQHPEQPIADVAYTYQVGRAVFEHRRMLVCRDREEAIAALTARDARSVVTRVQRADERPIVFMFAGMGDHYANMAQELYQIEPVFRAHVDHCAALLEPHLGLDIRDVLYPDRDTETRRHGDTERGQLLVSVSPGLVDGASEQTIDLRAMLAAARGQTSATTQKLNQPAFAQPAVFVVEYALAQLLLSWGIRPQALIGHSLGEYVAACLAGVFSLADALALVARRARMIQELPGGAMLAVPLSEAEVQPLLGSQLFLSAVNGAALCVVAGPPDAVAALEQQLSARGLACRYLLASHAMHSAMMAPIMRPFGELVKTIKLAPPQIPYISNVTGSWMTDADATDPDYWVRHLRQTVRFADGLRVLWDDPAQVLLEIGPGQALSTLALEYAAGDGTGDHMVLQSVRPVYDRRQPDLAFLLNTLGRLWLAGVPIDWAGFYADERRQRVPLPTYPFERQRYWIEPRSSAERTPPPQALLAKRPDLADWFYIPSWKRAPALKPFGAGDMAQQRRWLIFADGGELATGILDQLAQAQQTVAVVRAGQHYSEVRAGEYTLDPRSRAGYDELFADLHAQERTPDAIIHLWSLAPADHPSTDATSFRQAQNSGFYSLLFIAQALDALAVSAPLQLWVITSRLHAIDRDDQAAPEQATLLGPCKVIPQEYDNISCCCIDVVAERGERQAATLGQIMAEISAKPADPIIAYRGRWRWVQTFEALPTTEAAVIRPLREQGVYLITGGLGGIGLLLADYLAETVCAKLILTGRAPFPQRAAWADWLATHDDADRVSRLIRKIQALEARGAEVLVASADVADEAQMRAVIDQAYARFGALHGLIHAAGIAGEQAFKLIPTADQGVCETQFQPKVYGTYVVQNVLRGHPLDFCLLFSSNTAILGGLGMVAYAAANMFLDAFAQAQNRAGATQWISANWDGWLLTNEQQHSAFQTSIDQYAMAPHESVECFRRIVSTATADQVVVSTGDLVQRLNIWINNTADSAPEREVGARHPRPALPSSYAPPENAIEQTVARIWQELLGIEQVGVHDNFFDLGGHSLMGLKIISRLKTELQVDISVVNLFEGPTISALAAVIARDQQARPSFEDSHNRGAERKQKIRAKRQRRHAIAQEDDGD